MEVYHEFSVWGRNSTSAPWTFDHYGAEPSMVGWIIGAASGCASYDDCEDEVSYYECHGTACSKHQACSGGFCLIHHSNCGIPHISDGCVCGARTLPYACDNIRQEYFTNIPCTSNWNYTRCKHLVTISLVN
jgi:hypothetical protein